MQCANTASFSPSLQRTTFSSPLSKKKPTLCPTREAKPPIVASKVGVHEIAELAHNKVLIASALSLAIGQISKPFTSATNGNGIDLKAAIRSGGMPSTHSAAVAAASTSIGLERGFSDSIFAISVVFASVVMYDAQLCFWTPSFHITSGSLELPLKWNLHISYSIVSSQLIFTFKILALPVSQCSSQLPHTNSLLVHPNVSLWVVPSLAKSGSASGIT